MVQYPGSDVVCAVCACKGRGGQWRISIRPTPGCQTAVCTSDNGISPITGAPPHSLQLGKGPGALRHDNIPTSTRCMCGGAQCLVAACLCGVGEKRRAPWAEENPHSQRKPSQVALPHCSDFLDSSTHMLALRPAPTGMATCITVPAPLAPPLTCPALQGEERGN